jgi:heme/copper-type cytochrome/quinol oxidase subunit 2
MYDGCGGGSPRLALAARSALAWIGVCAATFAWAQASAEPARNAFSAFTWFVLLGVLVIVAALFVVFSARARSRRTGPPPTRP